MRHAATRMFRSKTHGTERVIAGVCAGLGRRYGLAPWTVRLLAILSCLLPGPQFVIYLILWVMMPGE